jgi:hypothetical protein
VLGAQEKVRLIRFFLIVRVLWLTGPCDAAYLVELCLSRAGNLRSSVKNLTLFVRFMQPGSWPALVKDGCLPAFSFILASVASHLA